MFQVFCAYSGAFILSQCEYWLIDGSEKWTPRISPFAKESITYDQCWVFNAVFTDVGDFEYKQDEQGDMDGDMDIILDVEADRMQRRRDERRARMRLWLFTHDLVNVFDILVAQGFFDLADVAELTDEQFRVLGIGNFGQRIRLVRLLRCWRSGQHLIAQQEAEEAQRQQLIAAEAEAA
eukprot:33212_1